MANLLAYRNSRDAIVTRRPGPWRATWDHSGGTGVREDEGLARNDWSKLDESDVRVRPGKGTRPRSKRRPEHADAVSAMVIGKDRGRWTCAIDADPGRVITTMRAREMGRTPVVVGDRVGVVGDVSGKPDTLAPFVRVRGGSSFLLPHARAT